MTRRMPMDSSPVHDAEIDRLNRLTRTENLPAVRDHGGPAATNAPAPQSETSPGGEQPGTS